MRFAAALLLLAACTVPEEEPPAGPCDGQGVQDEATGDCVPEACGAGHWGGIERTGQTVHVEEGGSGDGSAEAPLGDVQEALDLAGTRGSQVVLAAGTYPAALLITDEHAGVTLQGRCRELVTLDASGPADRVRGLTVQGGPVTIAELALQGSNGGLMVQDPDHVGVDLTLHRLELRENETIGLNVRDPDTAVVIDDLWIHDTAPTAEGTFGHGVNVIFGARLEAVGLVLERNNELGFFVVGAGSEAILRDSALRDTSQLPGRTPRGITCSDGASLTAQNLVLERNAGIALQVGGANARAVIEGGAIRDTVPTLGDTDGVGLAVFGGASALASDLIIEGNQSAGFYVEHPGSVGELRNSIIRGTLPRPNGNAGQGMRALGAGRLIAVGVLIEANTSQGVRIEGVGTIAELTDVQVTDTIAGTDTDGRGVAVGEGGALVARDVVLERNGGIGLLVYGEGSTADLEGVHILDTRSVAGDTGGGGMAVQQGASVVARGLEVARNRDHGILVTDNAYLELSDSSIVETQRIVGGTFGRGVIAQGNSTIVATDLIVEGNHDVGVAALGDGSFVNLVRGSISSTGTALDVRSGIGVAADLQGSVRLEDVELSDNTGPGVYSLEGGSVELVQCSLAGNGLAGAVVLDGELIVTGGSITGSLPHPSEGGGVGILAWNLVGSPWLDVKGTEFADLPGPALYLRGPGRYRMSDSNVARSGGWPSLPGGVLATDGVTAWTGDEGLVLQGNRFTDLGADAILLDTSAATLALDPDTGEGQTFTDNAGEALFVQRCLGPSTAIVSDGSGANPACQDGARPLGPLLEFRLQVGEIEAVE